MALKYPPRKTHTRNSLTNLRNFSIIKFPTRLQKYTRSYEKNCLSSNDRFRVQNASNIFRAIKLLQYVQKIYIKRNILGIKGLFFLCFPFQVYIPLKCEIKLQIIFFGLSTYSNLLYFSTYAKTFGFFRFKDRISLSLRSRIVYKYNYQCFNALYVGENVRHFHKRIYEDMGILYPNLNM